MKTDVISVSRPPTLIVDLASIFRLLWEWRSAGRLKDAREIAQMLVREPQRWIAQLAATGSDRFPNSLDSHLSFPDRRVIVPRGPLRSASWGETEEAKDLQRRVFEKDASRFEIQTVDVLEELERLGFLVNESTSTGVLHIATQIIDMAASGGMPPVLLLATSDPSIEPILRTVRASGVRTGLMFLGSAAETRALEEVADRFIGLPEVAIVAFGLTLERGFKIPEFKVGDVAKAIKPPNQQGFIPLDELWKNARLNADAARDPDAAAEIPAQLGGFEALLEEWRTTIEREKDARSDVAASGDADVAASGDADVAASGDADVAASGDADARAETSDPRTKVKDVVDDLEKWIATPRKCLVRKDSIEQIAQSILDELQPSLLVSGLGSKVQELIREHVSGYALYSERYGNYLGHDTLTGCLDFIDEVMSQHDAQWEGWTREIVGAAEWLSRREKAEESAQLRIGPLEKEEQVAQLVLDALVAGGGEVPLAALADRVANSTIGFDKSNDWGKYRQFADLLAAAEKSSPRFASQWEYESAPPGRLRLVAAPPDADVIVVRRFLPEFPNEDAKTLRLRAAVLASILGPMPSIGMHVRRQSGVAADARDAATKLDLVSGRGVFDFLLKSIRVLDQQPQNMDMQSRLRGCADQLLHRAGLPSFTDSDAPRQGLKHERAASVLLRIVYDSIEYFVSGLSEDDRKRVLKQVESRLIAEDESDGFPSHELLVDAVERSYSEAAPRGHTKDSQALADDLRAMLRSLSEDRRMFPEDPKYQTLADEDRGTIKAFLEDRDGPVRGPGATKLKKVHEDYEHYCKTKNSAGVKFEAFASAVAELERDGKFKGRLRLNFSTAPGWLQVGAETSEDLKDWEAVDRAIRDVSEQYLKKRIPVSWVDVAAALHRSRPEQ